ncbi:uncharacterized protein LOC126379687 [Pectinophora gossypiella]|uniref:uncharacterized protein LOC126379687 n=1 Tax=Pectinophora gossypiella TaxID=13191 RepID=UPI00214F3D79|nr:uncharacterized protein LOC126379687 [Pectinophora gossypiella]
MEDDIDIEEHDVLEHPRIRNIFPDITQIKTEVPDDDYEDDTMDLEADDDEDSPHNQRQDKTILGCKRNNLRIHERYQNGESVLVFRRKPIKVKQTAVKEEVEGNNCERKEATDISTEESTRSIALGRAIPSDCTQTDSIRNDCSNTEEDDARGSDNDAGYNDPQVSKEKDTDVAKNVVVLLQNWGPWLESSPCYCKECQILFPTTNTLQVHNRTAHSFDIHANEAIKSTAKDRNHTDKNTGAVGKYYSYCQVNFPDSESLIDHLYENDDIYVDKEKSALQKVSIPTKGFGKKGTLKVQGSQQSLNTESNRRFWHCIICGFFFKMRRCYIKHVIHNHSTSDIDLIQVAYNGQCPHCELVSDQPTAHNLHITTAHKSIFTAKGSSSEKTDTNPSKLPQRETPIPTVGRKKQPVPKSVLYKCNKCPLHFTSCAVGALHSKHCLQDKDVIDNWQCTTCLRNIKVTDALVHQFQHQHTYNFNVYVCEDNIYGKVLNECPKCGLYFCEKEFFNHVITECKGASVNCENCSLPIHVSSVDEHKHWHQTLDLTKQDLILVEYIKQYTIEMDSKVRVKRKLTGAKPSTSAKRQKLVAMTRKKLIVYYCEYCCCYFTDSRLQIHEERKCTSKWFHAVRGICKICGLTHWSDKLFTIHEDPGMPVLDFQFISVKTKRYIVPPMPNFNKCNKCEIYFLDDQFHKCARRYKTCNLCKNQFSHLAYLIHMRFHDYPQLTNVWKILYRCQSCDILYDSHDQAVDHCQKHFNNMESYDVTVEHCDICDLKFDSACFDYHKDIHELNDTIKKGSFQIITFLYTELFTSKWEDMLNSTSIPKKNLLSGSIYSYDRGVKLRVLKEDQPALGAAASPPDPRKISPKNNSLEVFNTHMKCQKNKKPVFQCAKCNIHVHPSSLTDHVICCRGVQFKRVAKSRKFCSPLARDMHEAQHKFTNTFKTVIFNEEGDKEFNETLRQNNIATQTNTMSDNENLHGEVEGIASTYQTQHKLANTVKTYFNNKRDNEFNETLKQNNLGAQINTNSDNEGRFHYYQCKKCKCCSVHRHPHRCKYGKKRKRCEICDLFFYRCNKKHETLHKNEILSRDMIKITLFHPTSGKKYKSIATQRTKAVVRLYKCDCGLHFTSTEAIEKHSESFCKGAKIFKEKCSKCNRLFDITQLVTHLCKHHINGRNVTFEVVPCSKRKLSAPKYLVYQCSDCQYLFCDKKSFSIHEPTCGADGGCCSICGFKFLSTSTHNSIHKNCFELSIADYNIVHLTPIKEKFRRVYKCSDCDINFISYDEVNNHVYSERHDTSYAVPCLECGLKFKSVTLPTHISVQHKDHKCTRDDLVIELVPHRPLDFVDKTVEIEQLNSGAHNIISEGEYGQSHEAVNTRNFAPMITVDDKLNETENSDTEVISDPEEPFTGFTDTTTSAIESLKLSLKANPKSIIGPNNDVGNHANADEDIDNDVCYIANAKEDTDSALDKKANANEDTDSALDKNANANEDTDSALDNNANANEDTDSALDNNANEHTDNNVFYIANTDQDTDNNICNNANADDDINHDVCNNDAYADEDSDNNMSNDANANEDADSVLENNANANEHTYNDVCNDDNEDTGNDVCNDANEHTENDNNANDDQDTDTHLNNDSNTDEHTDNCVCNDAYADEDTAICIQDTIVVDNNANENTDNDVCHIANTDQDTDNNICNDANADEDTGNAMCIDANEHTENVLDNNANADTDNDVCYIADDDEDTDNNICNDANADENIGNDVCNDANKHTDNVFDNYANADTDNNVCYIGNTYQDNDDNICNDANTDESIGNDVCNDAYKHTENDLDNNSNDTDNDVCYIANTDQDTDNIICNDANANEDIDNDVCNDANEHTENDNNANDDQDTDNNICNDANADENIGNDVCNDANKHTDNVFDNYANADTDNNVCYIGNTYQDNDDNICNDANTDESIGNDVCNDAYKHTENDLDNNSNDTDNDVCYIANTDQDTDNIICNDANANEDIDNDVCNDANEHTENDNNANDDQDTDNNMCNDANTDGHTDNYVCNDAYADEGTAICIQDTIVLDNNANADTDNDVCYIPDDDQDTDNNMSNDANAYKDADSVLDNNANANEVTDNDVCFIANTDQDTDNNICIDANANEDINNDVCNDANEHTESDNNANDDQDTDNNMCNDANTDGHTDNYVCNDAYADEDTAICIQDTIVLDNNANENTDNDVCHIAKTDQDTDNNICNDAKADENIGNDVCNDANKHTENVFDNNANADTDNNVCYIGNTYQDNDDNICNDANTDGNIGNDVCNDAYKHTENDLDNNSNDTDNDVCYIGNGYQNTDKNMCNDAKSDQDTDSDVYNDANSDEDSDYDVYNDAKSDEDTDSEMSNETVSSVESDDEHTTPSKPTVTKNNSIDSSKSAHESNPSSKPDIYRNIYKCSSCSTHFLLKSDLTLHGITKSTLRSCNTGRPNCEACKICGLTFAAKVLPAHIHIHHKQYTFSLKDFNVIDSDKLAHNIVNYSVSKSMETDDGVYADEDSDSNMSNDANEDADSVLDNNANEDTDNDVCYIANTDQDTDNNTCNDANDDEDSGNDVCNDANEYTENDNNANDDQDTYNHLNNDANTDEHTNNYVCNDAYAAEDTAICIQDAIVLDNNANENTDNDVCHIAKTDQDTDNNICNDANADDNIGSDVCNDAYKHTENDLDNNSNDTDNDVCYIGNDCQNTDKNMYNDAKSDQDTDSDVYNDANSDEDSDYDVNKDAKSDEDTDSEMSNETVSSVESDDEHKTPSKPPVTKNNSIVSSNKQIALNKAIDKSAHESNPERNILYKCSSCSTHFLLKSDLTLHGITRRTLRSCNAGRPNCEVCKICGLSFAAKVLPAHIHIHHKQYNFSLTDFNVIESDILAHNIVNCNVSKSMETDIKSRSQVAVPTHNRNILYKCFICSVHFMSYDSLHKHVKKHESGQALTTSVTCKICGLCFFANTLTKHMHIQHRQMKLSLADFKIVEESLRRSAPRLYHCEKCSKNFFRYITLDIHVEKCDGASSGFTCVCGLSFSKKSFSRHRRLHHKDNNYALEDFDIVNLNFEDVNLMQTKMLPQIQKRVQNISTNKVSALDAEKAVCYSNKLYKCNICYIHFLTGDILEWHTRNGKHDIQRLTCTSCGYDFAVDHLATHVFIHHDKMGLAAENFEFTNSAEMLDDYAQTAYRASDAHVQSTENSEDSNSIQSLDSDIEIVEHITEARVRSDAEVEPGLEKESGDIRDVHNEATKQVLNLGLYTNKLYKCARCSIHFLTADILEWHTKIGKHDIQRLTCTSCGYDFAANHLTTHKFIHHDKMGLAAGNFIITNKMEMLGDCTRTADAASYANVHRDTNRDNTEDFNDVKSLGSDVEIVEQITETTEANVAEIQTVTEQEIIDISDDRELLFLEGTEGSAVDNAASTIKDTASTESAVISVYTKPSIDTERCNVEDAVENNAKSSETVNNGTCKENGVNVSIESQRKQTTQNTYLTRYSGEKPYKIKLFKCGECKVCFLTEDVCYKHVVNHVPLDVKDYIECKLCGFQFLIVDTLSRHIAKHHQEPFMFEDVLIEEYQPTAHCNDTPKIELYSAIEKIQSKLVSTTS